MSLHPAIDPDNYDWQCVFEYANGTGYAGSDALPKAAAPGMIVSEAPFWQVDVADVLGAVEGENDGPPWVIYGKLKDGRFFSIKAGCDYTGWD